MVDFTAARLNMVQSQVRPNRVTDERVVAAMRTIPREIFVPEAQRPIAYIDEDLEIAPGRYLMEPMTLARLIQAAGIRDDSVVLVVGAATGYSTAVLAALAGAVVALECDAALAREAERTLAEVEAANTAVVVGPLSDGHQAAAPYDAILLDGSAPDVPDALLDQLAEGGRLVAVIRDEDAAPGAMGKATLFTRRFGVIGDRVLYDAAVPRLPGFERSRGFVF